MALSDTCNADARATTEDTVVDACRASVSVSVQLDCNGNNLNQLATAADPQERNCSQKKFMTNNNLIIRIFL